jgi:hypothetical protein
LNNWTHFLWICQIDCLAPYRLEGKESTVKWKSIENRLNGLNEVEVAGEFVVVLVGKDGKWGVKVWGKENFLQDSLQMWGKCGENREIENR